VTIHAWAVAGFSRGAADYERGRPDYPAPAVELLVERLRLAHGRTVVDVAAGTGKLARLLARSGARVVAVEPVEEMRALIAPGSIEIVAGTAEALPLPAGSADAVTVAQAFHWFRAEDALREFNRVLGPGGGLGILRNRRDPRDPVQREFERILGRHRAHPSLEAALDVNAALAGSGLFAPSERLVFPHTQELDRDGLVAQAASESSIALLDGDARTAALAEFGRLAESLPPRFGLRFATEVFLSTTLTA
jgi:SAM-dependent methyltransferase